MPNGVRAAGGGVRARLATLRLDDVGGVLVYGLAFAATAVTTYLFNAVLGRRLDPTDFSTFVALLGVMLALTGPSTALFGGGAMSSARTGRLPRMPWRNGLLVLGLIAAVVGFVPGGDTVRAIGWCGLAAVLLICSSWNRGLLVGLGRLPYAGATMLLEGIARITFAVLLVERGFRVGGAMAGLAAGAAVGLLAAWVALPRRTSADARPVSPEVWMSIAGLFFVGIVQYIDVVVVRLASGPRVGAYAAASSLARIAMYAQMPAAAYAIRRTAIAGPRRAAPRAAAFAAIPALIAIVALEVFPSQILSVTYAGRYADAAGLLRILAVAMVLAGASIVVINLCLGAGRVAWVCSTTLVAAAGCVAVTAVASHAYATAVAMTVVQAAVFILVLIHAHRLVVASRASDGGVLVLNWRDTGHPQGGGSEVFVREVATHLRRSGTPVTVFCADHPGAPRDEVRDGVRFIRRGSWRTVYVWAAIYHLLGRFGPHDVVVDVQNAIPFFAPLYSGRPVLVLVHHVHREQWGMLFGRRTARMGWWIESRLAPFVYRRASYVTVSEASRAALGGLGVAPERITVVYNGAPGAAVGLQAGKEEEPVPTVVYLGRLVPHKRVDFLINAAGELRQEFPDLRVRIVGQGAWEDRLRAACDEAGTQDLVSFEGYVDEAAKRRILAGAWVMALPSVMEGWGLAVMEAAAEGTPSVAFRVGGLTESIQDGRTGLLVDDYEGFVLALREMLRSRPLRSALGASARERARGFGWSATAMGFAAALEEARRPEAIRIPDAEEPAAPAPLVAPLERA